MKHNGNKTILILVILQVMFALVACSKHSGDTAHSYYWANGYCYDSTNGSQVTSSYCSANSGYYSYAGMCYNNYNQPVSNSYCTANNGYIGNNNQIVTKQCNGLYSYGWHQGYCDASNSYCHGYTLTEVSTGQIVQCQ